MTSGRGMSEVNILWTIWLPSKFCPFWVFSSCRTVSGKFSSSSMHQRCELKVTVLYYRPRLATISNDLCWLLSLIPQLLWRKKSCGGRSLGTTMPVIALGILFSLLLDIITLLDSNTKFVMHGELCTINVRVVDQWGGNLQTTFLNIVIGYPK